MKKQDRGGSPVVKQKAFQFVNTNRFLLLANLESRKIALVRPWAQLRVGIKDKDHKDIPEITANFQV